MAKKRTVKCKECGKRFKTISSNACYCGPECRQKAIKRQKAAERETVKTIKKDMKPQTPKPKPKISIAELDRMAAENRLSYGQMELRRRIEAGEC